MLGVADHQARPPVGRDSETALIRSLLDEVRTRGAALILRGEPGIGKSRMLGEAAALARERDMAVLSTTGVQSEARLAYAGLHHLLRPVRDRAVGLPPALRAALDAAFGIGDDTAPTHFRIAMAVLDLLSEVAGEAPLVVIVDDADWLDRASSDVLAFVARRLESDPIVLLAATRDGYRAALGDVGLPELRLDGLQPGAALELLAASAQQLTAVARERVLREAVGNPLALIELPLAAADMKAETPMPGLLPLTERLERAFAARVTELPDDTRLLLLVAALTDGENLDEVLHAASAVAGTALRLDALEPAVAAAIIDLDLQTVRFRHPLMRSAIRQDASVPRRRRVHEALAGRLDAEPDRRAWHRAAIINGPNETVAMELEEAGWRARRRGAMADAFIALRRAAELSERTQCRRRLLSAIELAYETGQPDMVAALLHELEQLGPTPLERARATWIEEMVNPRPLADAARIIALVSTAERAGEAGDRDLHIDLLWLVVLRAWWADPDAAVRQVLVEASGRLGDAEAADLRVFVLYAYADPIDRAPAVLARLRRAAADGSRTTDASRYLSEAAVVVGAFDLAMPFLDAAVDGLRTEGRLAHLPRTLALYGLVAARLAHWDVALPAAEESHRLGVEFGEPLGEARAQTVLSTIAGMRGDADAAERAAARAERIGRSVGSHATVALAQFGRVLAALAAGRHADAFRFASRLFDPADPAHHPVIACWLVGDLAEAAQHTDQVETAKAHVARVEAAAGDAPTIWIALGLRHARALLADNDQLAAQRFDEALGTDLSRWPFQRARLLLAQGQWLRRQRRIAESRTPLRAARDTFDALGCEGWSDRARRELRASGESSRRRDATARDLLTPQELQIVQLAAVGLSNREIGERLYLSPRTISTHLYRAFPKLGVTTRSQLGTALTPATALIR
jgi:DNA-binding CsgD family transcriptional regulator